MDYLYHKGFKGSVEYSQADHCLFGKVLGLEDSLILYEGTTLAELRADFEDGVNSYLDSCIEDDTQPETSPFPVSFVHITTPAMAGR